MFLHHQLVGVSAAGAPLCFFVARRTCCQAQWAVTTSSFLTDGVADLCSRRFDLCAPQRSTGLDGRHSWRSWKYRSLFCSERNMAKPNMQDFQWSNMLIRRIKLSQSFLWTRGKTFCVLWWFLCFRVFFFFFNVVGKSASLCHETDTLLSKWRTLCSWAFNDTHQVLQCSFRTTCYATH